MAKEKDSTTTEINGFTALFDEIAPSEAIRDTEDVHDMTKAKEGDWMNNHFNPDEDDDTEEVNSNQEDNDDEDDDDYNDNNIDNKSKESKVESKSIKETKEESNSNDTSDDEGELVEPFFDLFSQELGWDVEDETKPKSIKELVDYMKNIVEVNSKPSFASTEIADLNDFVKNGGKLEQYYEIVNANGLNLDEVDIESEQDQRNVVRELLSAKGYKKERIDRMVERYETAETLKDEAEDAIEELRELREIEKERLLEEQRNSYEQSLNEQQEFYSTVEQTIKELDNVRGISINQKDRQELLEYIFKPESDGKTKYQKDYMKSHRNLIESAFFTMKGDKLIKTVEQKATNDAIKNLKDKLKSKKITRSSTSTNYDEASNIWDLVSGQLQKP